METIGVTTPLGSTLGITTFSGREEISRLFSFQLGLVAPSSAPVQFEALIGQPVTVRIGSRYFSGIVKRFGDGTRGASQSRYSAEVVPWLWLLTRNQQSRIFQKKSVPDILAEVFSGFPVVFRVKGNYAPREYCVQYRETDFNFVSRIMEDEGIYYFFEHTANGHTLVVADTPDGHTPLPAPVVFDRTGASRADSGVIYGWETDQELRSGLVTLRDHEFEFPNADFEVQAQIQPSVLVGTVTHQLAVAGNSTLEIYDYPGGYAERFDGVDPATIAADGARTAGIRMQEEALGSLRVHGSGSAEQLAAGYGFGLEKTFYSDGDYVVTSVTHSAQAKKANGPVIYTNTFSCIPAGLPYRPSRTTPKPTIEGTQTAVVTGPPGQQIYTDQYGRVKVKFYWDREGKKDETSSRWIRVGHPPLGPGVQPFLPEVEDEVIVAFEEGDPDRPIVLGVVG